MNVAEHLVGYTVITVYVQENVCEDCLQDPNNILGEFQMYLFYLMYFYICCLKRKTGVCPKGNKRLLMTPGLQRDYCL